ncbi:hypothetical protein BCR35DRAFT_336332 [Leucosporidium creatinivorum]|uniref:Uncharacterized protein n=1 Tax=Leucosporidium creatinivorum TaxID=106004 RepID=A0A1Y2CAQ3_9BASI|nr:hypothetical protein BCR35DRAFT_336332 [Leucosporidium creatinivorum]
MTEHDRLLEWLRGNRTALSTIPGQPKRLPATLFKDLAPFREAEDKQHSTILIRDLFEQAFPSHKGEDSFQSLPSNSTTVETIDGRYVAGSPLLGNAEAKKLADEEFYLRSPRVILAFGYGVPVDVRQARWNYITHLSSARFVSAPWLHSMVSGVARTEHRQAASTSVWLLRKLEEDGQLANENGHEVGILVLFFSGAKVEARGGKSSDPVYVADEKVGAAQSSA